MIWSDLIWYQWSHLPFYYPILPTTYYILFNLLLIIHRRLVHLDFATQSTSSPLRTTLSNPYEFCELCTTDQSAGSTPSFFSRIQATARDRNHYSKWLHSNIQFSTVFQERSRSGDGCATSPHICIQSPYDWL